MRYKTKREDDRLSATIFLLCVPGLIAFILEQGSDVSILSVIGVILGTVLALVYYVYCCTANVKRNRFVRNGERFRGRIVSAEVLRNGRGEDTYYLFIEFYDRGKKIHFTEGYVGNPCNKLRNLQCYIYKLNNKYMEAGFSVLNKNETRRNLHIPTKRYKLFARHKGYV